MPERTAEATWQGGLKDGNGSMSMQSGSYQGAFSFASRFEQGDGTNPEELIAASHAGCFSMALSAGLEGEGFEPERVSTTATVTLEEVDGAPTLSRIHLETEASVPGIDEQTFQQFADDAKQNCPVSRALAGHEISLNATLV